MIHNATIIIINKKYGGLSYEAEPNSNPEVTTLDLPLFLSPLLRVPLTNRTILLGTIYQLLCK